MPKPSALAVQARVDETGAAVLALSPQEEDKIRKTSGGTKTLDYLRDNASALFALELSRTEILSIASHDSGSLALGKVLATYERFMQAGFEHKEVVAIAANNGGSKALDEVLATRKDLNDAGFKNKDIAAIAAHAGASLTLRALLATHEALKKARFEIGDIVAMAANQGGSNALETVLAKHEELEAAGFKRKDIVAIASNGGGAQALKELLATREQLRKMGFVDKDLAAIATKAGGAQALKELLARYEQLKELGFGDKDLLAVASRGGGAQALQKLLITHQQLTELDFEHKDIVAIASNNGGSKALDKVLATYPQLTGAGFAHEDIVAIAAKIGGSMALSEVLLSRKDLNEAGFENKHIAKIAANVGGRQALKAVLETEKKLKNAGFGIDHIVAMVAHNGGAAALRAVATHLDTLQKHYSNDEIVKAATKPRGAGKHVEQLAYACVVKQEASPSVGSASRTVLVERPIDQARTAFVPELPHCDLTGSRPQWRLDETGATVVRHAMEPVPANNHKFPMRGLNDPLGRVYERYAGDDGQCHPDVTLRSVDIAPGYKNFVNQLYRDPRVNLPPQQIVAVRKQLIANAQAEFERLIRGEHTDTWPCEPRKLSRDEVPRHEQALAGQYGLFLKTDAPDEAPLLKNGRILGFYMGVFAANDKDIEIIEKQHPDYARYALEAPGAKGRLVVYSAQGCANDLAFANTALLADAPTPTYDQTRINATFVPFEVKLTDKKGKPASEKVIAVVALNNAIDKELRIDYGNAFLQQFLSGSGKGSSQGHPVKMEMAD